jgi:transcriptional regulator GlxA family with amidase domain
MTDNMQSTAFTFVLLEGFSALSMTSAVETLRITNETIGNPHFTWSCVSEHGKPITNSLDQVVHTDGCLPDSTKRSNIVVCGGPSIAQNSTPRIVAWLRRQAVFGSEFIGLCSAAYTLAVAGLLNGKRATIHWQESEWFRELFPNVLLSDRTFERDGKISTTAGGVASIDLFLDILGQHVGEKIMDDVTDRLLYRSIRDIQSTARISKSSRIGFRVPKLVRATAIMESHLENPLSTSEIASMVGVSARQLERLFKKYLNQSPGRFSLSLRLEKARQLLASTELHVIEISLACGFGTPSNFSKCFRNEYGRTPHAFRSVGPPSERLH